MVGITKGSTPITGVYVGNTLATGFYVGAKPIWPPGLLGAFHLGVGTFELLERGLLVETDNSIRIAPRAITLTGKPLQSAITQAFAVDLQQGTAHFAGRTSNVVVGAESALHAGALSVASSALAVVSGHIIPAITGSLHFAGAPLPMVSGNEVAAYISLGTLQFTPLALTASTAAAAAVAVAPGALIFTGTALSMATGSAVSLSLPPASIALSRMLLDVGTTVSAAVGVEALAFQGAALYPPADVVVSVLPEAVSIWGHYATVDTSPFALRRVGSRSTVGVTSGGSTNVLLPPGSSAGDLALIATQGPLSGSDIPPTGSTAVENQQLALYRYTLTAADALSGYVAMKVHSTAPIVAEVFHDADPVPDAVGTYASSTVTYPASTAVTFGGLTTTRLGAEPVAFLVATNAGSININTPSPATWDPDAWNVGVAHIGVGIMRGPAQAPGSVADATWAYNYAVASGSSTRGALMLAVRPAVVNMFADLSPGALALPTAALTVPWTQPDVSLSLRPDTLVLPGALIVEPMDVSTVTFIGSGVAYNGQNEANGSSTQLPLPAGTQAGDYMFVNFGMNGADPNDMPRVPPDSQMFHTTGEWFSILAYWIPIIPRDVANGYITVDPRAPCSFPYVVYRAADRYLQAVGTIVTPDPNVQQNGTLLVPGLPALQASGAAIIALTTTDAVNADVVSGPGEWDVNAAAPWMAKSATTALIQPGGGGLRSAVLWNATEIGASTPDTLVSETVWSQFTDATAAQMFAIRSNQHNVAVSMGADTIAFSPVELVPPAAAVSADCSPGTLTLAPGPLVFGALAWLLTPAPSPDVSVYLNHNSGTSDLTSVLGLYPDSTQSDDSLLVTILTYGNGSTIAGGLSFTEPTGAISVVSTEGGTALGVNSAYGFILTQYVIPRAGVTGSGEMTIACDVPWIYYNNVIVTVARVADPYQYVSGAAHAWGAVPAGPAGVESSITVTGAASSASDGVALSLATAPVPSPSSVAVDGFTALTPDTGSTLGAFSVTGAFYDLLPSAGAFSVTGAFDAYDSASSDQMGLVAVVPFVPVAYIATNVELPAASPGAAFSGTLQASNRLGASGTLVATPPSGITLGAPATADSITSWPFSGTAGGVSETLTFSLTNGTQTATAVATLDVVTPIASVGTGAVTFTGRALTLFTSTAGTGVSAAMGTGALAITAQTLAENVTAAATAASYVGANIFTSASGNAPLPAGCQAGDWLFIAPTTNAVVTLSAPASPDAQTVIADFNYTPTGNNRHLAVWRYRLTATDISNGYVAITTNANRSQLVVARSSQATNPVDVSNTSTHVATTPPTVTVGSITTTVDGVLLLLIDATSGTSPTGTFTTTGFTTALTLNDGTYKGGTAYLAQSTKGATGDITATFSNGGSGASGAALIAVKP